METRTAQFPLGVFRGATSLTGCYLPILNIVYLQGQGGDDDNFVILLCPNLKEVLFTRSKADSHLKTPKQITKELFEYHGFNLNKLRFWKEYGFEKIIDDLLPFSSLREFLLECHPIKAYFKDIKAEFDGANNKIKITPTGVMEGG